MAGWANFHWTLGDIHVRQFLELVIHAGQLLLHIFSRLMGNVQVRAAMFAATAFAHFGVDGAGYNVTGGKLHALGIILLHETLAFFVAKNAAFTAHGLSN